MSTPVYDVAIVGAGAAGLTAAIFAVRAGARVALLDGAKRVGAKILISGGGRCNVTHDVVTADDFNGSSRNAVAKVLRTFTVPQTVAFFESLGVQLKVEETGKLFPVSGTARSVLDALLRAAHGADLLTGHHVDSVERDGERFRVSARAGEVHAAAVVIAAGGRSVPKTGSDGSGYALVGALGHSTTVLTPALVPLVLPSGHWLTRLSGTSVDAELSVKGERGRVLRRERGSMLFTHFGLSGPVVLDISRHWIAAKGALHASLLPGERFEELEQTVIGEARRNPRATAGSVLRGRLPEKLTESLVASAGLEAQTPLARLTRERRRGLLRALLELPLPIVRDRGYDFAEVTAGGVPLSEVELSTMASRFCPGLYLCGEILDVDGRIGGYNFQWAWASGRLAGMAAGSKSER